MKPKIVRKIEQIKLIIECRQSGLSIYLFCGRRCDRIKVLLREPDGYVLLYKRIDVMK